MGQNIYPLEVSARQERENLFCWLSEKTQTKHNTNLAVTVRATTNPQQRLPEHTGEQWLGALRGLEEERSHQQWVKQRNQMNYCAREKPAKQNELKEICKGGDGVMLWLMKRQDSEHGTFLTQGLQCI